MCGEGVLCCSTAGVLGLELEHGLLLALLDTLARLHLVALPVRVVAASVRPLLLRA